jgi:outer membrane protein W
MKGKNTALATLALLAVAPIASAQGVTVPAARADLSGAFGWLSADKSDLNSYRGGNDWYNRSLYGGASLGWYWNDHLKTEIEGGVSSAAELWVYTPTVINGRNAAIYSTYRFSTSRLVIGQQYQFFRNVWFHPFVGAGLDLTWEHIDRIDEIASAPLVRPDAHPRRTEELVRPFATVGLKAYFTPRAFVRTDMKFTFDKGIDEALVRFGLGVDF